MAPSAAALAEPVQRYHIDTQRHLDLEAPPRRLRDRLILLPGPRAAAPRFDDLRADGLAGMVVPAFKQLRRRHGALRSFCSLGSGVGLDALTAVEIPGATRVGVTDLQPGAVRNAEANILANLRAPQALQLQAGYGGLFESPGAQRPSYDLVCANCPACQAPMPAGQPRPGAAPALWCRRPSRSRR
jgi:hypothetical protein